MTIGSIGFPPQPIGGGITMMGGDGGNEPPDPPTDPKIAPDPQPLPSAAGLSDAEPDSISIWA